MDYNTYKIYLKNNNSTIKEIRKFKSPRNCFDYEQFCQKIWNLFPELSHGNFILSWEDHEDDEIVISSNEEFKLAEQSMNNSMLLCKFYVKMSSGCKNEKVSHPCICCNNCGRGVVGYRYKCIQCEDYDLCEQCEAKSLHPEHYMIRMPQPVEYFESEGLVYCLRKFLKKSDTHSNKKHGSNEYSRRKKKCDEFSLNYDISPWLEALMPYLIPFMESKNEPCSTNDAGPSKKTPKQDFDDAKDDKASVSDSASTISQDSVTKATAESPEISRASSVLSNLNESTEKQIPSAPTSETNSSQKKIYPQLPEDSKIYHSNPRIQSAVETMIRMGFSNQGGLLTCLLEAENGDINKVLDLLQSINK